MKNIIGEFSGMKVIASNTASTKIDNESSQIASLTVNVPSNFDGKNALLVVTRSSWWWDSSFANNISGDFDTCTKLYEVANGHNSGRSTDIQAGTALGIYFLENLTPGGTINISGEAWNNPQLQAVLLQPQQ